MLCCTAGPTHEWRARVRGAPRLTSQSFCAMPQLQTSSWMTSAFMCTLPRFWPLAKMSLGEAAGMHRAGGRQ